MKLTSISIPASTLGHAQTDIYWRGERAKILIANAPAVSKDTCFRICPADKSAPLQPTHADDVGAALAAAGEAARTQPPAIELCVRARPGSGITGQGVKVLPKVLAPPRDDKSGSASARGENTPGVPEIDDQSRRSIARMLRLLCTEVRGSPKTCGSCEGTAAAAVEAEPHDGISREYRASAPILLPRAKAQTLTGRFGTLTSMVRPKKRARGTF